LLSYLVEPLLWTEDHQELLHHSNYWEVRAIAKAFLGRGITVEAINFFDAEFIPIHGYQVVFDISWNLGRLSSLLPPTTLKLLHLTGSDPVFQNEAEKLRVAAFNERSGSAYLPRRVVPNVDLARQSMDIADSCSLIGNSVTLGTFPLSVQRKTTLIPVSGSALNHVRSPSEYVPAARHFLWFFGNGAVLKGLDLVLEVFLCNPQWTLHVVGDPQTEEGFMAAFAERLASVGNIHFHGYLAPSGSEFANATRDVVAFIAPSASEGISPAVATCLQYGFYPIISRHTGIDLPDGAGKWLEECTVEEIERSVGHVFSLPKAKLVDEISETQAFALQQYSRSSFQNAMNSYLDRQLDLR